MTTNDKRTDKLPYFRWFPKDFLGSKKVRAMDHTALGCYVLLLNEAWDENPPGTLPNDDPTLASWARIGLDTWVSIKGRVMSPFELKDDGRWHQPRMTDEAAHVRASYDKRANAGRKGGIAKASNPSNATNKPSIASPMLEQCSSRGSDSDSGSYSLTLLSDDGDKNEILTAIQQWSGTDLNPVRGELQKVRTALLSWEQDKPVENGKPVLWNTAVLRCIKAAMAKGTPFKRPEYAITIISNKMAEFSKGIPPEQQSNGQPSKPVGEYKPTPTGAWV